MTSFPKELLWNQVGEGGSDVYIFPFLEISRKYNSGQNYTHNFAFPKMDDDLNQNPEIQMTSFLAMTNKGIKCSYNNIRLRVHYIYNFMSNLCQIYCGSDFDW